MVEPLQSAMCQMGDHLEGAQLIQETARLAERENVGRKGASGSEATPQATPLPNHWLLFVADTDTDTDTVCLSVYIGETDIDKCVARTLASVSKVSRIPIYQVLRLSPGRVSDAAETHRRLKV